MIKWLDQAVEDLKALRAYVARENPSAAAEIGRRLREAVRLLGQFPSAGRLGRVPNTRELVISGTPYILPYRVRGGNVEILRVIHGAQDWPDL
jgi:toxin ParE1/3/4